MLADPKVYNSPEFDATLPERANATAEQYTPPEPIAQDNVLMGQPSTAQAFIQQQANTREKASVWQSLDAAVDEMSLMSAYRYLSGPTFAPDPNFAAGEQLPTVRMQLDKDSREFLLQATSQEEFDYKVAAIERVDRNGKLMGDNMVASFGLMALDPTYLAIDAVSAGAGHAAALARLGPMAQRAATAATATAGAAGMMGIEAQTRPMSTAELVGFSLLNGAASAMFYNPATRKLEPVNKEYPSETLADIAQPKRAPENTDIGKGPQHGFEAPNLAAPRSADELAQVVSNSLRGTEFEDIAEAILRAPELKNIKVTTAPEAAAKMAPGSPEMRGFVATQASPTGPLSDLFGPGPQKVIALASKGADTALHELTHAVLQTRLHAPEGKALKAEMKALARNVREEMAKSTEAGVQHLHAVTDNLNEFMAYAMSSPTFREWAKSANISSIGKAAPVGTPTPPLTVWDKFVDLVASAVGMGRPRMARFLEQQAREVPAGFKALDERLGEIAQKLTADGKAANMFTRGTVSLEAALKGGAEAIIKNEDTTTIKMAKGVSWSLHKTLGSFGPEMRKAADILVDDPLIMTGDSVVSQTRAIRADLAPLQYAYEDKLKSVMAAKGFGLRQRIFSPRKALEQQNAIESSVAMEMLAREQNARLGRPHPANTDPDIKAMADHLDRLAQASLQEMQAAGVRGADAVAAKSGYFSRRWDLSKLEDVEQRLMAAGLTEGAARSRVVRMLAQGMRRANGWDDVLAGDVAQAVLDRTRRKGYFEDGAFRSHAGNENLAEVRDILQGAGVKGDRLQRAMDVLAGVTDEAGKASILKHRVDIDMKAGMQMPDGSFVTVANLLDTNLTNITEKYLDTVAGRAGLARKGLEDQSAIDDLRKTALAGVKGEGERAKAAKLIDDTLNAIQGRPVGDDMPAFMRASQAATRMVGLASSGLWQITEYAPAMARFGALTTLKHMLKEMPGARQLFTSISKDVGASTQLKDILTRNSSADIRMRPFVQRLEDNFEIPANAQVQLALSQAQQLVPYMNAQKFVQTHQARVMANLMIDTLNKAAKGDRRAAAAMEQYGLKPDILVELADDIRKHGMDTANWSDGTWAKVRGPITKAMDDAVLRNRTGEIPAFAQFSQLGKFIFTFRSFVLGAHNKVLAGTAARDGLAGLSLTMLYQFPLAALANLANSTIQGKVIADEQELVAKSFGQMGSFGLFSDVFGIVSGEKQQFGAPGLIMIDRLYKTAGQVAQGNAAGAADAALSATPILSIIPGIRAIGAALKE